MTTPSGEGPHELADMPQLSELQATDALLDRLGSREVTDDDLLDPVINELARLADFADAPVTSPPELGRLIEVLGGRPLYVLDRGSSDALSEDDQPIQLGLGHGTRRVIDLSDSATAAASTSSTSSVETDDLLDDDTARPGTAARAARAAQEQSDGVTSLSLIRSLRAGRRPAASRAAGLHGVIQQVALPAASIIAVALLSGGVTAVVAGDPMAPIDGVQRIASQLPGFGGSGSQGEAKAVRSDLNKAQSALKRNEVDEAGAYLRSASIKMKAVPAAEKPQLQASIDSLKSDLVKNNPLVTSTPSPSETIVATPEPSVTPTPATSTPSSTAPTPTPTDPAPSTTTPPVTPSASTTAPAAPVTVAPGPTGAPIDPGT